MAAEGAFTLFATGPHPECGIKGVIEAIMLTATVFMQYTMAAAQDIAIVALAAFSARVSTIQGGSKV